MKKRWKLDSYELKYNPKSLEEDMEMSGEIVTSVNGLVTSSNRYFEKDSQFVFDIFEHPTSFSKPIASFNGGSYVSVSQKSLSDNVYALRSSGNFYDTYSATTGALVVSGNRNLIPDADISDWHAWRSGDGSYNYATKGGDGYWTLGRYTASGGAAVEILMNKTYAIKPNTDYVQSFYFKSDGNPTFGMTFFNGTQHRNVPVTVVDVGGGVKRAYGTYRTLSNETLVRGIDINGFGGTWTTISIKDAQLEEGTVPSAPFQGSVNFLGTTGNAVAMTATESGVAVTFDNGSFVKYDENTQQISKYTYNDIDVKNTVGMTYDFTSGFYLMSKFGKVIKVDNQGVASLIYQFNDYDANSAANNPKYRTIYYYHDGYTGYLGILGGNEIVYYNISLSESYKIELNRYIRDISYSIYSGKHYVITNTTLNEGSMNLSGIDVERVKSLVADGAVIITDEHNMTRVLVVTGIGIKRLRNLQESRFEISISGKLM